MASLVSAASVALIGLMSTAASANVVWRGDFKTTGGNSLHQYGQVHCGGTDGYCPCTSHIDNSRLGSNPAAHSDGRCGAAYTDAPPTPSNGRYQIVTTSPGSVSDPALRVEVDANELYTGLNRNDLIGSRENPNLGPAEFTEYSEGDDRYVSFSLYFPNDGTFPNPPALNANQTNKDWMLLYQYHHDGNCGPVPVSLDLDRDPNNPTTYDITLISQQRYNDNSGVIVWSTPLVKGQWLNFVIHTKFSTNAGLGQLELWYNGTQVYSAHVATLYTYPYAGDSNYCSDDASNPAYIAGAPQNMTMATLLYRDAACNFNSVAYFKGLVMGTTYGDVTGGGGSCAPLWSCNGTCVDETSDRNNCGGCGTICGASNSCCNALCVNTTNDINNCGGCGIACGSGQSCVSSSCVTTSTGRFVTGTDINADLMGDFLTRDSSGNFQVWRSNATVEALNTSFLTSYDDVDGYNAPAQLFVMDLNGDGKADLLARNDDGSFQVNLSDGTKLNWDHQFNTTLSAANGWDALVNRIFPADVNGDGKTDLLARQTDGTWQVWLSNGTALTSSGTFTSYYTDTGSWGSGDHFYFLDINGDGKTDFIARGQNGGWDVNISNGSTYSGSSSFATTYTDANGFNGGNHFFVADVNGDRKGDLLVRNANGTFDVWKSNGTTLVYSTSFTSYFTDASGFQTGNRFLARDVNGDGMTDLIMRYANGAFEEWFSDGTTLYSAYAFSTSLTDANGWNSGFRFY